jgi:hypothetical protein
MTIKLLINGHLTTEEEKICNELLELYSHDKPALQLIKDMARQKAEDRSFTGLRDFLKAFQSRPSQVTDDDSEDESFQKGMLRSPSLIVNDQFPPFK